MRRGITLIELMFVVGILAILAAVSFGMYAGTTAQARVHRTQAIIAKLDQLVTAKWDEYRTRAVPIRVPAGMRAVGEPFSDTAADTVLTNGRWDIAEAFVDQIWQDTNGDGRIDGADSPNNQYDIGAADLRLYALRELMRCEFPNTRSDVLVNAGYIKNPALMKAYRRRLPTPTSNWTGPHEGAECLYLIIAAMRDGEDSALSWFSPSEIGDVDGDGMNEILDGFGNPIEFVRWPAGYVQESGAVTHQTKDSLKSPDQFDPLKVDGRYRLPNQTIQPFAMRPLIYSAGPDKEYGVQSPSPPASATWGDLIDPYHVDFSTMLSAGSVDSGSLTFADNITNHDFSE